MNAAHVVRARHGASFARVLVACLCTGLGLLLGPVPASDAVGTRQAEDGSIGIRLLEAPENRRGDPRALIYVVDHVRPGTTITRRFAVTNSTDTRQRVRLYVSPADIVKGQFVGGEQGATSDLTSWATTSLPRVGLAPGEETEQTVTIEVPEDASRGERYGVLWASVRARGSATVRMINRVGIRIYLDVGRGGEPASNFTIDKITPSRAKNGQPTLSALVTNTGGRALDVRGQVRLRKGPGGLKAGPFDVASTTTLAPGDRGTVDIALDKGLPAGPWRAKFVLHSGELERRAAATVTFPESGKGSPVAASPDEAADSDGSWWSDPWTLTVIALGLALLLALALAWLLRRRRGQDAHARGAGEPSEVTPARGAL